MAAAVESMAYTNEVPWHGLGFSVSNDLTPLEMMAASKTDWKVEKYPCFTMIGGAMVDVGRSALVRETDNKILDIISPDWNPTQNEDAFKFFSDYTEAGSMTMETAGSLNGGRNVWALAKIDDSFEPVPGDVVQSYLLFSNPHKYGQAITVRYTPVRVVCNNTLSYALEGAKDKGSSVSVNHRQIFNPEEVKKTLNLARFRKEKYQEAAVFLASKRFDDESIRLYFDKVFPKNTAYAEMKGNTITAEPSKPAQTAFDALLKQPGTQFAEGTFWQAFNAVSYTTDHLLGRSADNRLRSAWFGVNMVRKQQALKIAVEMAEAA